MLITYLTLAASVATATEVSVVWRNEKPSGSTSLTVYSAAERNTVLAEACGNAIGSLDLSRVDEHGDGSFTAGPDEIFDVFSEPTNGASPCTRMYNDIIAVVECTGVQLDVPAAVSRSADCFSHEHAKHSFERLKTRSVDILTATDHVPEPAEQGEKQPSRLSRILGRAMSRIAGEKRAASWMSKRSATEQILVGDGNPHQNYHHKQLSVSQQPGNLHSTSARANFLPLPHRKACVVQQQTTAAWTKH
jgi:hypothetical protein